MLSTFKFKLNLHKSYFEKGMGLTSLLKYAWVIFGLSTDNLKNTFILGFAYAFFCYCLGWFWFNKGWYEAEIEVGNQYNLLAQEIRKKFIN